MSGQEIVKTFVCTCDQEDAERAKRRMSLALLLLSEGSSEQHPRPVTSESLLSEAVFSLAWVYEAEITGILCDQWFAIVAETFDKSLKVIVECDELELGVAELWLTFYERGRTDEPQVEKAAA